MNPTYYISGASLVIAVLSLINSVWWGKRSNTDLTALTTAQNVQSKYFKDTGMVTVFNNSGESIAIDAVGIGDVLLKATDVLIDSKSQHSWSVPNGMSSQSSGNIVVAFTDCRGWSWERTGRLQPRRISK